MQTDNDITKWNPNRFYFYNFRTIAKTCKTRKLIKLNDAFTSLLKHLFANTCKTAMRHDNHHLNLIFGITHHLERIY